MSKLNGLNFVRNETETRTMLRKKISWKQPAFKFHFLFSPPIFFMKIIKLLCYNIFEKVFNFNEQKFHHLTIFVYLKLNTKNRHNIHHKNAQSSYVGRKWNLRKLDFTKPCLIP